MSFDDECMAIFALRYCIGRMSMAPSICADYFKKHWNRFPNQMQIIDDLQKEIEWHEVHNSIGMKCDQDLWHELLDWMRREYAKTAKTRN